jgi:steroid 5-alpha reductase family enzyme
MNYVRKSYIFLFTNRDIVTGSIVGFLFIYKLYFSFYLIKMSIDLIQNELINIFRNKDIGFYCKVSNESSAVILAIMLSNICFILSQLTQNYSWVDRLWSFLPTFYFLHFNFHSYYCQGQDPHIRQIIMLILAILWSTRLTYNYYRKGGYSPGSEDYRWKYVQKFLRYKILMELMNFIFIAYIQNILLMLMAFPIAYANKGDLNVYDYVLIITFIVLLAVETIADQQQWDFQQEKIRRNDNMYKKGFITSGLFRYSRHPNFFAEMCIWWVVYLFSHFSFGFNWTGLGAFLLTLLFQGSTLLTESISSGKYPEYKNYQKTTSRFFPSVPSKEHLD